MEFQHEPGRFFVQGDNAQLLAEVTYLPIDGSTDVVLDHTYVDPSLRGQGIAGKLVNLVVEEARTNNFRIEPLCPYALSQFEQRADYQDVLRPLTAH